MLIIFINIGFFVMATVALWRQRKNKTGNMDRKDIGSWLKAMVFLLVVMGLTWILGVLVVNVKALLPLTYIYIIMVAFQGLSIFLSVVIFQPSVRNEFVRWWKNVKMLDRLSNCFTKSSNDTTTLFSTVKVYLMHFSTHQRRGNYARILTFHPVKIYTIVSSEICSANLQNNLTGSLIEIPYVYMV